MMKKKRIYIILLSILLILTLFLYFSTFMQPKIDFTVQINKVSANDNKEAYYSLQGASAEKIRNINLRIKITAPFGIISHAKIEKDISVQNLMQQYLNDNTKIHTLGGGIYQKGDGTEYNENITININNTSEDEIKSILGDLRIKIVWENIWKKDNYKVFYIKDYLK